MVCGMEEENDEFEKREPNGDVQMGNSLSLFAKAREQPGISLATSDRR